MRVSHALQMRVGLVAEGKQDVLREAGEDAGAEAAGKLTLTVPGAGPSIC
jgi:hypothetical protein